MILIGFIIFGKKRLGFGFWIARGSSGVRISILKPTYRDYENMCWLD